ncbi:mechanosensitive ion channel family protein [Alteromonas sp. a30]|uniref:mechanosensitive ion channel family protein n=1 Tax=Alteromonas sp. a30 TaxID=2730917 RepID=UPI00228205B1|nr:mechanosensitive ion channel domain-containing protein [Alteromonas sp. a30]MCY7295518.1 mechanosensitive ion channel [Alteromonas sp. a30]
MAFSNPFGDQWLDILAQWGESILPAVITLVVGLWLVKRLVRVIEGLLKRKQMDEAAINFINQVLYVIFVVVVFISVIDQLGVDTTSLIAVLGATGLAVGLALKGSLENLAAGILLVSQRPFKKGNFIEGAGVSGFVDKITMLNTRLKTVDNKIVVIPNASLVNDNLVNFSANPTRRLDLIVGVSYDDDLKKVKTVLQQLVEEEERVLPEPSSLVAVCELADSSVNFTVRMWLNSSDYWSVKFAMLEKIKLKLDEEDITIPFPQRDVHLYQHGVASSEALPSPRDTSAT